MNARPDFQDEVGPERYAFPASFAQQRLWFLDQLEGAGPAWNVRLPVRLKGPLDVAILERALAQVVARHESLRTTFGTRGGEILQFVAGALAVPLERVPLPGASEAELRDCLGRLANHSFDLRTGPLLRACLVELASDDHALLLLTHHVVSDAWSSGVLFRDLAANYAALLAGRAPALPELPVQYADFAVWQRDWLAGAGLEEQAAFWREHLAGAPLLLDLPLDHPRPRLQTSRGSRLSHGLSAELTAALKALAAAEGVTLFMLLFAAFNLLLARWSGQQDLVVGTPIAGRRRTELEGLVGFFANTLALRTRVDAAESFRGLLTQVRATALAAFTHQDLPFEKLVEVLQPPRSLAHSPVFQVLFVLQNAPWEAAGFADLAVTPAEIAPGDTARFDLSVSAAEYEGQLWLGLEYSTDLFEADTIARLAAGFQTLLAAVVATPGADLARLPVESPADRARQLQEWQPAPRAIPADLYGMLADQVLRTPDATAVECGGARLTYAALEARAAALSARLLAAGVTGDAPVALCLERSPAMLVAVLAVLRAGAHYLPLDPAHPPGRLAFMLQDSGARVLLAPAALAARLPAFGGQVLDPAAVPATAAGMAGPARVSGEATAYLIYTSGSTGQPKGVRVPRRAVANFLASMAAEPGLAAGERLLAVTTLAFDIAVLELLLPLTVGATTVIATGEDLKEPARLRDLLATAAITVLQATPALWRQLLAAGWEGSPDLRAFCGGEALDRELATRLLGRCRELWNLYGPTETTVWSTVARVRDEPGPVSIGRPIANTRCYVLDDGLQPVPIGARGELWIGGAGVALGYHGRPELTAEHFRPDPFAGGSMYRTGDRAGWLRDGRLQVQGRMDFQVKLRGFRIEPGEIEAALLAEPGVAAAVVVLREVAGDPRLVAYLVPRAAPVADEALLAALGRRLPAWMIPSSLQWLTALPLTPNGKVDRSVLPLPGVPAGDGPPVPGAPMTAVESAVARLFRELLGAPVGVDDDFFARGGHSLLATRLLARIRSDLLVTLPLRTVFEFPTVRGLATVLAGAVPVAVVNRDGPGTSGTAAAAADAELAAPVSLVQQRLWFLDRLQPGDPAYHLAWAFELRGPLDRPALQAALDGLAARHASLRTTFRERDGEPLQVIGPARGWPLEFVTAPDAAVPEMLATVAAAPFQLAEGPLARTLLVETAPDRHTLLLVLHHIIADGWSFGVLTRELASRYAAALHRTPPGLPPVGRDYAAWAREQRRSLADGELLRQLDWWRSTLKDAPPFLDLPTDRPRPALPSRRGARYAGTLPPALQVALGDLARREGCTLFMVLLAAFDVLLARCAGTDDVVVGTPVAGRADRDLDEVVGFFVNTLVLRTDLRGNPTVGELLARVRATTLDAFGHADVPFELLVETLQPPRSTSHTPLFQVLFNLHNEPGAAFALDGLAVQPVAIARHAAKFDLSVSLAESAAGLHLQVEYSTDLFLGASIGRLVADYEVVLGGFVAAPAARLTELPCSASTTLVPAPTVAVDALAGEARTPFEAFMSQVARHPEAPAVSAPAIATCPAVDWSYATLAGEAALVAAALLARGLRPGDRVGLWFGQGAGQVAAILGVLQAGGVYVPLDPLAPPARLDAVIRDADLHLIVTDRSAPAWEGDQRAVLRLEDLPRNVLTGTPPIAEPATLAYLLYTSGSTGTPKGVPQTQGNLVHFVGNWAANLGLAATDRLSLLSTIGYDAAVQDIFGALLTGAAVCPLDVRRLARETLLDRVADRGLTVLHGTPTVYRYLFGGHVACRQDLSRVRLVVLGGEAGRRADFDLFRARFRRGARFVNGYGLTEATAVTQWFADHTTQPRGQSLPIGRPLPGTRLQLLDEAGAPAPFTGELVIDNPHVAPGYWPLAAGTPPSRRFHTGDLARWLPDGSLVFVGRKDERVKVGGIRIEPGDIEAALCTHPAVGEALVLAREERPGEPVLVAFCTPRPGVVLPAASALRAHLATLLPSPLIPARFAPAERLPRLPNGKVDRQALRTAPLPAAPTRAVNPGSPVPPDAVHAGLQAIWQALLNRDRVGLDDDFFLLGGHSLLATRLVARIRDRFGVELPLIRVFEAPTIRGLAAYLVPAASG